MASLLAVRIWLRWVAWEAISCCHSVAAVAVTSLRALPGSIGSRQAQAAKRDFRSSTAMRYSGESCCGAVRGKPPEARKMRASSAPVGSIDVVVSHWKASRSARAQFHWSLGRLGSGSVP